MEQPYSIVVAQTKRGGIGYKGGIPWHLPEDLRFFKRLTTGHVVIMGRKTWESLPPRVRPLPDRVNIVLTHSDTDFNGATTAHSRSEALQLAAVHPNKRIFVIGGAEIYKLFYLESKNLCSHVYVTKVDYDGECDARAPLWISDGMTMDLEGGKGFSRYVIFNPELVPETLSYINLLSTVCSEGTQRYASFLETP